MERGRFNNADKDKVHRRAGANCEFDSCTRPNNRIVHHITGVFEGKLKGVPMSTIENVNLNAIMLCDPHTLMHDKQERYQVDCLIYEKRHIRANNRRIELFNRQSFNQAGRQKAS